MRALWLADPFLVFAVLITPTVTTAQATDLGATVANLLKAAGPVPVTRLITVTRERERCIGGHGEGGGCRSEGYQVQVPQTQNEILTATKITISNSDPVIYGPATRTELPDQFLIADLFGQSCKGAQNLTINEALQKSFQRSASVQFQHSVTHTTSQAATIGLSIKVGESETFTVGGQVQFQNGETDGTVSINGTQETVTRTHTVSTVVLPGSAAVLELKIWPVHFVVPFSTTVIVDADLSANDKNIKHLSDVYPDASTRTFPVSGTIDATDASEGVAATFIAEYDPSQCVRGATQVLKKNFPLPTDLKLTSK